MLTMMDGGGDDDDDDDDDDEHVGIAILAMTVMTMVVNDDPVHTHY